jgi:hypothetical protein
MYIESFQWKYDPNCNSAEISRHCCTCFYTRFTRHKLDSAHVLQWLPPIWLIQLGPFFYSENCDKPLVCTLQVLLEAEISNMRHVFRLEKNMYEGSFGLEWFILGWSWVCNAQICPDPSACLQPRDSFRIGKSCDNFIQLHPHMITYPNELLQLCSWTLNHGNLKGSYKLTSQKGVNRIMNHNWGVYTVHMCKAHMLPLFSAGVLGHCCEAADHLLDSSVLCNVDSCYPGHDWRPPKNGRFGSSLPVGSTLGHREATKLVPTDLPDYD